MDRWLPRMVIAAGIASLLLSAFLVPAIKAASPQSGDILTQVLGGTTDLAAEQAYREADVYFHAGMVGYRPCHEDHHDGDCDHEHEVCSKEHDLPLANVVSYLHGETAPKAHKHLEGEETREMLPWFIAAVRLNPHLIDAYSDGCYWFYRSGDPQSAEEFISDGIRHNPNTYRLYLDRGILHHRMEKWEDAVRDLEKALELWKDDSEDAPYDLRAIRTFLRDSEQHLEVSGVAAK